MDLLLFEMQDLDLVPLRQHLERLKKLFSRWKPGFGEGLDDLFLLLLTL
jgi:hypothetical protein